MTTTGLTTLSVMQIAECECRAVQNLVAEHIVKRQRVDIFGVCVTDI